MSSSNGLLDVVEARSKQLEVWGACTSALAAPIRGRYFPYSRSQPSNHCPLLITTDAGLPGTIQYRCLRERCRGQDIQLTHSRKNRDMSNWARRRIAPFASPIFASETVLRLLDGYLTCLSCLYRRSWLSGTASQSQQCSRLHCLWTLSGIQPKNSKTKPTSLLCVIEISQRIGSSRLLMHLGVHVGSKVHKILRSTIQSTLSSIFFIDLVACSIKSIESVSYGLCRCISPPADVPHMCA